MKTAIFRCLKEDYDGFGLVNYNNKLIRVKGMVIGEEGEFEIDKNSKNPLKLIKVLKKNDLIREKPNCPFYKECGGCLYQGIKYEHELELKESAIKEAFSHFRDFTILPIEKSYVTLNYRNKSQKVYKLSKSKRAVCGFYTEHSKDLVSITDCKIEAKKIIEIVNKFNQVLAKNHIDPYDEYTKKGIVKTLIVRFGFNSKELMLVIGTVSEMFPGRNNVVKDLLKEDLGISTIIQSYNEKERILFGKGFIVDSIYKYKFKITSNSFYPINSLGYELLIKNIIDMAKLKKNETILDINSNVSILDICLSSYVDKIIAFDSDKENTKVAISNIKLNNITNIDAFSGSLRDNLSKLKDNEINTIIITSPREGLDKDTINKLSSFKNSKLIIISSNVKSLEQNAYDLASSGYSLKELKPLDLAPRTNQVTLIASFTHKLVNQQNKYIPQSDIDMINEDKYERKVLKRK